MNILKISITMKVHNQDQFCLKLVLLLLEFMQKILHATWNLI